MIHKLIKKIEDMSIRELLEYKVKIETSNGSIEDKKRLLDLISNKLSRSKSQDEDIFVEQGEIKEVD